MKFVKISRRDVEAQRSILELIVLFYKVGFILCIKVMPTLLILFIICRIGDKFHGAVGKKEMK